MAHEADWVTADDHLGWSVVVTGRASLVADPAKAARYQRVLSPSVAGEMDQVIRIRAEIVTGFRLGARPGAGAGLVAALAADAPEITSAVTALVRGQASVGAGEVIGSNVFNLAALLGLAAVVAGQVAFHRRVVLLAGIPGLWVAVSCLLAVTGVLSPATGLALACAVLIPVTALLGLRRARLQQLPLPPRWTAWMAEAVSEEETELLEAIHPRRGTWRDALAAAVTLAAVVVASTTMELAATAVGRRYAIAGIVTGGIVLAVVTSLPNAVSAVYLARRGRGAAVLSTALNRNAINVIAGLLIPASLTGLGPRSGQAVLVAAWYAGLTVLALVLAWQCAGLRRLPGVVIIAGYLAFTTALLISAAAGGVGLVTAIVPAAAVAVAGAAVLAWPRLPLAAAPGPGLGWRRQKSAVRGWSTGRVWRLSLLLCTVIAACDAVSGPHLTLVGLLIVGPCCALLTARWLPTAAAGCYALALGVVLGIPDQIFATIPQYAFLAAIAITSVTATAGAVILQRHRP